MRKCLIFSVLAVLLTAGLVTSAIAMPIGPSAGVGLKGGFNLAKMSELEAVTGLGEPSNDIKMGFIGGGFARFALGPINVQVEGLYSVRGMKGTFPITDTEWETSQHYFEVPFLLKFEVPLPALGPYLYAGPTWSYLLKAEDGDGVDIKDNMKSTEWSLAIGGGLRVTQFHFDVRYQMGLTELEKEDSALSSMKDSKSRTVSFFVGYELLSF